jgi:hypothetical protein
MFKVWHKSKMFLHVQNIQTSKMDNPYFFSNVIFFTKGFALMKIIIITYLSTFGLKMLLTLKIMNFENVILTKVVNIYVIEGMNV